MSVKTLIKDLKKFPPDMHVVFLDQDGAWSGEARLEVKTMQMWDIAKVIHPQVLRIRGVNESER